MVDVLRHVAVAAPDIHWRCLAAIKAGLAATTPRSNDDGGGGFSISQIEASMHESKLVLLSEAARFLASLSDASSAAATLAMVYRWARAHDGTSVDVSLVRHFVVAAAHVVSGPFTLDFLRQFLCLVETGALSKLLPRLAKDQRRVLHRVGVDALAALSGAGASAGATPDQPELRRLQDLAKALVIDDDEMTSLDCVS